MQINHLADQIRGFGSAYIIKSLAKGGIMQRLLNRSWSGSTRTGVGALVGALLVAATALVASPAGASNQSNHLSVTRVAFGAVDIGTAGSDSSIVTNHTGQPLYFVSATPSNN